VSPRIAFIGVRISWLPKQIVKKTEIHSNQLITSLTNKSELSEYENSVKEQLNSLEGLDSKIGLRNLRNDVKSYLKLLKRFDQHHFNDTQEIREYLSNNEFEGARQKVHMLKGTTGTLGLVKMQDIAISLEKQLLDISREDYNYSLEESSNLVNALYNEQKKLQQALLHVDTVQKPATEIEVDNEELQKVLNQLKALLEKDETSCNTLFLEYEEALQQAFGHLSEQLGKEIESFDYPAAIEILNLMSLPTKN